MLQRLRGCCSDPFTGMPSVFHIDPLKSGLHIKQAKLETMAITDWKNISLPPEHVLFQTWNKASMKPYKLLPWIIGHPCFQSVSIREMAFISPGETLLQHGKSSPRHARPVSIEIPTPTTSGQSFQPNLCYNTANFEANY